MPCGANAQSAPHRRALRFNAGIGKAHEETSSTVHERLRRHDADQRAWTDARGWSSSKTPCRQAAQSRSRTPELGSIAGKQRLLWESLAAPARLPFNMLMKQLHPRAMLAIHTRSCWSRQAGSGPTWEPRLRNARSRKASRSSWKISSAGARLGPACAFIDRNGRNLAL